MAKKGKPRKKGSGSGEKPAPDAPKPSDTSLRLKKAAMLEAFVMCANIAGASRAAGVTRTTHYAWLKDDPEYAAAFAAAEKDATDFMISEARRRAVEGTRKLKFHEGNLIYIPCEPGAPGAVMREVPCKADDEGAEKRFKEGRAGKPVEHYVRQVWMQPYVEHEYSDTLLIFLLKARDPATFREKHEHQHTGEVTMKLYGKETPVEDV